MRFKGNEPLHETTAGSRAEGSSVPARGKPEDFSTMEVIAERENKTEDAQTSRNSNKLHRTSGDEARNRPTAPCQANRRRPIRWSFRSSKSQRDHLLTTCEHCRRQALRITSSHENLLCRTVSCSPAVATAGDRQLKDQVFIGQVYPSGNVYVKSFSGTRVWPKELSLVPLVNDRPSSKAPLVPKQCSPGTSRQ